MDRRNINDPQHAFRFLDVDEEPQRMLSPIKGYKNTPLVSLNQAIAPIEPIVPDIKNMVQAVRMNYEESEDGLTRDESNSIKLYSLECQPRENSLFYKLNKTLRSDNRQQLRPWFLFLRLILTALSKLSSTFVTVYRGVNMHYTNKYPKDATITWWSFSSCMKKNNQLEKRLFLTKTGNRTLFVINCYSGKDVHRHSMYEDEVLLPPARQFKVVNTVNKGKGFHIIELNEIEPAFDFFDAFVLSTELSITHPTRDMNFEPISTVSLSKKSLPAALPNPRLEEHIAYIKPRSKADLSTMRLEDSDMDIVVSEIIIKRQCLELNVSRTQVSYNGLVILALALRKNKVGGDRLLFS
jgi:hypothetical protein